MSAPNLFTGVLGASLTLVRLSGSYGKHTTTPIVGVLFLVAILWALPQQRRNAFASVSACLLFIFVADIAVALFRGASDGDYKNVTAAAGSTALYVMVVALGILGITTARDGRERDRRIFAILLAPVAYATVNGVMSAAGITNPGTDPAILGNLGTPSQLLGFIGIHSTRVIFPLASSVNLYSVLEASSFAAMAVLLIRSSSGVSKRVAWFGLLIGVVEVAMGDSRATFVCAFVVIVLFLRRRFVGWPWIALAIPLLPLLVVGGLHLISDSGIVSVLSRGAVGQSNVGSFTTGTGRLYIWQGAWDVIKHFQLNDVIGWGAAGQVASGASVHYLFVFPHDPLGYTAFTHDLPLQVVIDEGYIGLAILIAVVYRTFLLLKRHLRARPDSPAIGMVAMLLVIILSGATEVTPTYYAEEVLVMTLLIAGAAVGLAQLRDGEDVPAPVERPAVVRRSPRRQFGSEIREAGDHT